MNVKIVYPPLPWSFELEHVLTVSQMSLRYFQVRQIQVRHFPDLRFSILHFQRSASHQAPSGSNANNTLLCQSTKTSRSDTVARKPVSAAPRR